MGKKETKAAKGKTTAEKSEKKLKKFYDEISNARKKYIKAISKSAAMDVEDYSLKATDGTDTKLSEMFGDKENLILIHNMGKSCPYCTLWADGFSGVNYFIEKKAAFVLVSPDAPDVQKEFAESRGWKFRTYSAMGSSFTKDMGFLTEKNDYWPGVSVFHKGANGKLKRVSMDIFGPGDFYSSPFHLFDLLPQNGKKEAKV